MKKIFVLMALTSFSLVSADRFITRGDCGQWDCGNSGNYCCDSWGGDDNNYVEWFQADHHDHQFVTDGDWHFQGINSSGFQRVGDKFQISDQEISKKVHDALNSGKSFQDLLYRVDGGVVTLQGHLDTLEHKTQAEDIVKKVDGVKSVNSHVAIVAAAPVKAAAAAVEEKKADNKFPNDFAAVESDKQINAKIREKLNGGWFSKGYDAVILRTNNGFVIITGAVDTQDEANKLNEHVQSVEGVKKVNVQVAVKKK